MESGQAAAHLCPLTSLPRCPSCQVKNVLVDGMKIPGQTEFVPTGRRWKCLQLSSEPPHSTFLGKSGSPKALHIHFPLLFTQANPELASVQAWAARLLAGTSALLAGSQWVQGWDLQK